MFGFFFQLSSPRFPSSSTHFLSVSHNIQTHTPDMSEDSSSKESSPVSTSDQVPAQSLVEDTLTPEEDIFASPTSATATRSLTSSFGSSDGQAPTASAAAADAPENVVADALAYPDSRQATECVRLSPVFRLESPSALRTPFCVEGGERAKRTDNRNRT
jgi:hypothetical protein